jgi:polysaccharide export outer membrane protein
MKFGADYKLAAGFIFVVLSGSLLGQAPASSPSDQSPAPAPPAVSPESGALVTAVSPQSGALGSKAHDNSFVIGNDDRLAINVWKEPELTRSIPVRSDGKISLPLAGEVQAAGRTPLQLEQEIATKLLSFITDPEVTVIVEQINSQRFNILGQVGKPGTYSLSSAATVLDAIAAAGGFRDFAKQTRIYILRQNAKGAEVRIPFNYKDVIKGKNPEQNIKLEPRDTIVVP